MRRLFRNIVIATLTAALSYGCSDRITKVEDRLDRVEARADSLEARTVFLEEENSRLRNDVDFLKEEVVSLDRNLFRISEGLGDISVYVDSLMENIDALTPPEMDNSGIELETPPYMIQYGIRKVVNNDHQFVDFRGIVVPLVDLVRENGAHSIFYASNEDLQNLGSYDILPGTAFEVDSLGTNQIAGDTLFAKRVYRLEVPDVEYGLDERRRVTYGFFLEGGFPKVNYSLEALEEIGYESGSFTDESTERWSLRGHINVLDDGYTVVPVVFSNENKWTSGNLGYGFRVYHDGVYLTDPVLSQDAIVGRGPYKYMIIGEDDEPRNFFGVTTVKK